MVSLEPGALASEPGQPAQREGTSVEAVAAAAASGHIKLTPLEQQVLALKQQHPDVLLVVEVRNVHGYDGICRRVMGGWVHTNAAFELSGNVHDGENPTPIKFAAWTRVWCLVPEFLNAWMPEFLQVGYKMRFFGADAEVAAQVGLTAPEPCRACVCIHDAQLQ